MKTLSFLLPLYLSVIVAWNNNNNATKTSSINLEVAANNYPYVTAKINEKPWQSVQSEILATYSEFNDKLQIFTKDNAGNLYFL